MCTKKGKYTSKPLAEAVAKHIQEAVDYVAQNVDASTAPPTVDIEVIEPSKDEETPVSRDFSVTREVFKLEVDHEKNDISW